MMIKGIKLLFCLLLLLSFAAQATLTYADGGLVFEPYMPWSIGPIAKGATT